MKDNINGRGFLDRLINRTLHEKLSSVSNISLTPAITPDILQGAFHLSEYNQQLQKQQDSIIKYSSLPPSSSAENFIAKTSGTVKQTTPDGKLSTAKNNVNVGSKDESSTTSSNHLDVSKYPPYPRHNDKSENSKVGITKNDEISSSDILEDTESDKQNYTVPKVYYRNSQKIRDFGIEDEKESLIDQLPIPLDNALKDQLNSSSQKSDLRPSEKVKISKYTPTDQPQTMPTSVTSAVSPLARTNKQIKPGSTESEPPAAVLPSPSSIPPTSFDIPAKTDYHHPKPSEDRYESKLQAGYSSEATVTINIGRIEIKAMANNKSNMDSTKGVKNFVSPTLSLKEYLRKRSEVAL
jgi:hypothetical protein